MSDAKHDLIFFEKRSTPKIVLRGEHLDKVPEAYGKQTKRRFATEEEEKQIARGDWVRVDENGKKGGEDGYKKTKMAGREHLVHGGIIAEETDISREAIAELGYDPDNLGFVGLEMELPAVYRMELDDEWEYNSPTQTYVKGYSVSPHITLIYGLLFQAHEHKDWIDGVLSDWHKPNVVLLPGVEAFHGDDGNEEYSAIVLTLDTNDWDLGALKGANDQLRKLPHVNGFPVYRPHVTVGYVKREFADLAVGRMLNIETRPLISGELDYGTPND